MKTASTLPYSIKQHGMIVNLIYDGLASRVEEQVYQDYNTTQESKRRMFRVSVQISNHPESHLRSSKSSKEAEQAHVASQQQSEAQRLFQMTNSM